jgi:hypothetical protein
VLQVPAPFYLPESWLDSGQYSLFSPSMLKKLDLYGIGLVPFTILTCCPI